MKFSAVRAAAVACLVTAQFAPAQTPPESFEDLSSRAQAALDSHPDEAAAFIKVFKASDPKNPDGPMLAADYYALMGQPDKAIASLNDALKLGYDDFAHFSTDAMLNSIRNDAGYGKVYKTLAD